jgi:hypothetical protein
MSVSDNRETKYIFEGLTIDSVYLNPSNNESATVVAMMTSRADGTIDLLVSPGENNTNDHHFYYLGAMKILYEHEDYAAPVITLVSPNGGEQWEEGTTQTISWTADNLTEAIVVSYSTDNGTSWTNIDTVSNSEVSLLWEIPDNVSVQCLVMVSSGMAEDVNDAVFEITLVDGVDRNYLRSGVSVYPNPFLEKTTIEFETKSNGNAELRFYDLTGRETGHVHSVISAAGRHELTITNEQINSNNAVSICLIRITDTEGTRHSTIKMVRLNIK